MTDNTQRLIDRFSDRQTLPVVAIKINQLSRNEDAALQEFENVIKLDPVLVTRLLRLVNSAFFSLPNKVESITKAIVLIGMQNLLNLVNVEAIKDLFRCCQEAQGFSPRYLWVHSATVAILAQMIARRIFSAPGESGFLAGILHDIGLIVEHQTMPCELAQAFAAYIPGKRPLLDCEQEFLGTDHCQIGNRLVKEFQVAPEILKAVAGHHNIVTMPTLGSPACIIQIADYLASNLNYATCPGKADPVPPLLASHLRHAKAQYRIIIQDLPKQMAQAAELYEI